MDKLLDNLLWTLKLYSLTLVIPIAFSIINIVFVGILGVETVYGFWMNFKILWVDYYFTGSFVGIDAWRWHLALLFCAFLFTIFETE